MKTFKTNLISFMAKYGTLTLDIILEIVLICCTIFNILEAINGHPHPVTFGIYVALDAGLFIAIAVEIVMILRKNKNDRS